MEKLGQMIPGKGAFVAAKELGETVEEGKNLGLAFEPPEMLLEYDLVDFLVRRVGREDSKGYTNQVLRGVLDRRN